MLPNGQDNLLLCGRFLSGFLYWWCGGDPFPCGCGCGIALARRQSTGLWVARYDGALLPPSRVLRGIPLLPLVGDDLLRFCDAHGCHALSQV